MNRTAGILLSCLGVGLLALVVVVRRDPGNVLAEGCEFGGVKSEDCLPTVELSAGQLGPLPIRNGDINADGDVNLTDAVFLLNHLFLGGAEPPPLVCARCETGPKACVRFTNGLLCGDVPFAATLTVCENETLTANTDEWSSCVCVDPGDCRMCVSATPAGCEALDFCGNIPLVAGKVYAAVLYFDAVTGVTVRFIDEDGNCSKPPPDLGGAGAGAGVGSSPSFASGRTSAGYTGR